eukprot:5765926-Pyramimonas_sp.AAC.1
MCGVQAGAGGRAGAARARARGGPERVHVPAAQLRPGAGGEPGGRVQVRGGAQLPQLEAQGPHAVLRAALRGAGRQPEGARRLAWKTSMEGLVQEAL